MKLLKQEDILNLQDNKKTIDCDISSNGKFLETTNGSKLRLVITEKDDLTIAVTDEECVYIPHHDMQTGYEKADNIIVQLKVNISK